MSVRLWWLINNNYMFFSNITNI